MAEETGEVIPSEIETREAPAKKDVPYLLVGAAVVGIFLVAIVVMLIITGGDVAETKAPAQLDQAATAGKALFIENKCGNCHPAEGRAGGIGPRLSTANVSDDNLRNSIKKGRGAMPAYSKLSNDQVENLVIYLRALKPAP